MGGAADAQGLGRIRIHLDGGIAVVDGGTGTAQLEKTIGAIGVQEGGGLGGLHGLGVLGKSALEVAVRLEVVGGHLVVGGLVVILPAFVHGRKGRFVATVVLVVTIVVGKTISRLGRRDVLGTFCRCRAEVG